MVILPYDTKSQSRNASCVPFRGRGPRSGEGMCEGKNDYDTLILCLIALRSGGRRLAVRIAMEHPIGTLPRTPFPASRDFAPVGSMSLDSRVAGLPYESSSFATSRGNEKIGGTGYCVTYDTESQSRNADFISIARRAIRNPQRRSRCRPLSEANTTFLYNLRRQPRPFFLKLRRSRHHNPRPERPSNLRTLRPQAGQS